MELYHWIVEGGGGIGTCLWDRFSLNTHPKTKATSIDTPVRRAKKRGMIHNSRKVAVEC